MTVRKQDKTSSVKTLDYHSTVRDLPTAEQPRKRLKYSGAQSLSMAELLAIILRTGTSRENALELAGKLLAKYGGLAGLVRADFGEVCAEYGMGEAKTAQLKAALEIGLRMSVLHPQEKYSIHSPADAANLVMVEMAYLDHEQMRILVLDTKNRVVANIQRYIGTVDSSILRASEVFRPAITFNAPGIILCHNHPSGVPDPSQDDIETTLELVEAGALLDIQLVDHIIIGDGRFVSMKEILHWNS